MGKKRAAKDRKKAARPRPAKGVTGHAAAPALPPRPYWKFPPPDRES